MSACDYAYQSLASTGQKVSKRPRIVISAVLATIALFGVLHLLLTDTRQPYGSWEHALATDTAHGSAPLGDVQGRPPTRNLHMTEEQCDIAFPDLYKEASRAQQYYSRKGGISKQDVDEAEGDGNARVVILNNTVSSVVFAARLASRSTRILAFRQSVQGRLQLQDAGCFSNGLQNTIDLG
jgi:hypothetical protein